MSILTGVDTPRKVPRKRLRAKCTVTRRPDGRWSIVVIECPNCGAEHYHGGGSGPEPELGERGAHCRTLQPRPVYTLVVAK